jgi:hypothetical protein
VAGSVSRRSPARALWVLLCIICIPALPDLRRSIFAIPRSVKTEIREQCLEFGILRLLLQRFFVLVVLFVVLVLLVLVVLLAVLGNVVPRTVATLHPLHAAELQQEGIAEVPVQELVVLVENQSDARAGNLLEDVRNEVREPVGIRAARVPVVLQGYEELHRGLVARRLLERDGGLVRKLDREERERARSHDHQAGAARLLASLRSDQGSDERVAGADDRRHDQCPGVLIPAADRN